MLDKKLNKLKKFVPKNSKVGKALALKDKLTGEDKKGEEEKKKKRGSGGTPSTMSIAKVVFGSGIAVGGAIAIGCIGMSVATMFSTVTGTSVQIIDGSIIQYGEPTPGPEKDKKKNIGAGEYNGDELYMKLKMIVEAVEADNSLKKKVDKVKVPDSVPGDMRSKMTGKRGGIYHILQVGYIFKELSLNEWCNGIKDKHNNKIGVDWRCLLGIFCQENCCGASMEQNFPEDKDGGWLYAYLIDAITSNETPGPFQTGAGFFGKSGGEWRQISFVTSIENPDAGEYGKIGFPDDVKSVMKQHKDKRINTSWDKKDSYFFADNAASSIYSLNWNSIFYANEYWTQLVSKKGNPEDSKDIMSILLLNMNHRGPAFYTGNHRFYSTGVVEMLAEAAVDGLLNDDELLKYMPKVDNGAGWKDYQKALVKDNGIIDAIMKDDKLNLGNNYKELTLRVGDGYPGDNKGACGNQVPDDIYADPFYRLFLALRCGQEIEALANAAFDELGLTLPTSGSGKMELKETKGEFQGFWSDKNGKTLSSDEMKAYTPYGSNYKKNYLKFIGTKEDGGNMNGKLNPDKFATKFSDNIGFIQYHQGGIAPPGTWEYAERPYKNSHSHDSKYCWTYSCGMFVTSEALSTLLHKYVHPFEIAYAQGTYNDRHGTSHSLPYQEHRYLYTAQARLIEEQRYKNKKMFNVESSNSFTQNKVDACLAADGIVTVAMHAKVTNGGHFIIVREKTDGKYYLGISNAKDSKTEYLGGNRPWTWSELTGDGMNPNQVNYITPAEGYQEYLNDYMTSQSEASGGSGGSGRYLGEEIVEYAKTFVGKLPYNHGLSLTSGTDCSGFVKLIYQHFGKDKNMPRTSYDQYDYWISKGVKKVQFKKNKLKPGDLLYYIRGSKIGHVAMYAGNGKVVHESNETDGCKISDWDYDKPKGVFRILSDSDVSSSGGGNGNGNLKVSAGDYPYWTQGDYGTGTSGKCKCPQPISGGCFVYSLMKIARASGSNFDVKSAWNTIRAKNYAGSDGYVNSPEGIMKVCGVNVEYKKQETGKFDFSTSTGKKKLSKLAKKYMKQGYYVIARIGTSSTDRHFLNICSSDGKTFDVWDSGSAKTTKGGANNFINVYKNFNGRKETWLYNFRLVKVK